MGLNTAQLRASQWYAPLLLGLLALVWGSSFILYKKALLFFSPAEVGGLRVFTAACCLAPMAVFHIRNIPVGKLRYFFLSGMCGSFLPYLLFAWAGKHMPSAIAGALNALTPGLTVVVGGLAFGTAVHQRKLLGLGVALAGSLVLAFTGGFSLQGFNGYTLAVLAACTGYAFNLNITKNYLSGFPVMAVSSITNLSILPLGIALLWQQGTAQHVASGGPTMWAALVPALVLGCVNTAIAQIIFTRLVQLTTAVYASTVTYLMPLVAIFWGVLDGETFGLRHLLGSVAIIVGVLLVNRRR